MQSELDRWQTERNRLRAFLNNQQTRQSMLEEQNSQLRQEHSRLVEENSRLFSSTSADSPIHLPSDILSVDVDSEATNLQNLASAIAEVGRDNYSTRGAAPARQRLYDWAATHRPNATTSQDPTMPQESSSRLVDNPRYRELDRALHNYRVARSSLRSERPGNDLGTVPTAAALRAYWNEDEQPVAADHRPPFSLHNFVERHRRDRAARTVDSTTDVQATDAATSVPTSLSDSAALKERIRNTIRYLSKLRKSSPEGGLQLARLLHLDVLYECDDANTPSDLPLLVDNLPQPQPSSWLAPGMTWHGLQSTDRDYRPGTSLLSSTLRSIRQREYFGRSTIRRGVIDSQHSTYASILSTNPEARDTTNSDRYLSSLMRDPDGRWGFSNTRDHAELPDSAVTSSNRTHSSAPAGADADHWPVTVTLHTVDYDSMTVTGTMRASQIPDRNSTGVGKSMESYFQGEIIDFRNHSLETDSRQGYKVGGCDVDARYWSRLGPFKHAIEKQASSSYWESSIWEEKLKTGDAKYFEMLRAADRENREIEADRVMMQCLGNQRWLQKHLGSEWVLMRWKGEFHWLPQISNMRRRADTIFLQRGASLTRYCHLAQNMQQAPHQPHRKPPPLTPTGASRSQGFTTSLSIARLDRSMACTMILEVSRIRVYVWLQKVRRS